MSSLAFYSSLSFGLGAEAPVSGNASSPAGNGVYPFGGGIELTSITHNAVGDLFVPWNK